MSRIPQHPLRLIQWARVASITEIMPIPVDCHQHKMIYRDGLLARHAIGQVPVSSLQRSTPPGGHRVDLRISATRLGHSSHVRDPFLCLSGFNNIRVRHPPKPHPDKRLSSSLKGLAFPMTKPPSSCAGASPATEPHAKREAPRKYATQQKRECVSRHAAVV